MSKEQLLAMISALQTEKAAKASTITMRVSKEKRVLCIYGLGVRPVSLYASQWQRITSMAKEIDEFIAQHRDELAWKE